MFRNILLVCIGNICRSPTAEAVLRHRLQGRNIVIGSAGLQAMVGHAIDPTAGELLSEHGIDAGSHRARQLDGQLLTAADLVLAMENRHVANIARDYPQASGKTFLLGKWRENSEVPDPYRQQRPAFEHVYKLIDDGVNAWLPYIR